MSASENAAGEHGSTFTVTIPLGTTHLPTEAIQEPFVDNRSIGKYAKGLINEASQWNGEQDSSQDSSEDSVNYAFSPMSDRIGSVPSQTTLWFTPEDTVLVVDDSKDLRKYITSILQPHVKRVIEAQDGEQGLALAEQHRPQLIISDVQMPKMSVPVDCIILCRS